MRRRCTASATAIAVGSPKCAATAADSIGRGPAAVLGAHARTTCASSASPARRPSRRTAGRGPGSATCAVRRQPDAVDPRAADHRHAARLVGARAQQRERVVVDMDRRRAPAARTHAVRELHLLGGQVGAGQVRRHGSSGGRPACGSAARHGASDGRRPRRRPPCRCGANRRTAFEAPAASPSGCHEGHVGLAVAAVDGSRQGTSAVTPTAGARGWREQPVGQAVGQVELADQRVGEQRVEDAVPTAVHGRLERQLLVRETCADQARVQRRRAGARAAGVAPAAPTPPGTSIDRVVGQEGQGAVVADVHDLESPRSRSREAPGRRRPRSSTRRRAARAAPASRPAVGSA